MKYHAILFMCNDEKRARFVIENFTKHNPDIGLTVYNGGESYSSLQKEYNIELIESVNPWHKKTRHAPGSFNFTWFQILFETYKRYACDYLLFLETDVKVTKKIEIEPKYDLSGVLVGCGLMESLIMYDFWGNYLKGLPFEEDKTTNWSHKFHTGMGGTALSRKFFEVCEKNLDLVKLCYETIPLNCYQDVVISCFARYCGCTIGDWEETSDTRGTIRIVDNNFYFEQLNENCSLIHNYKI